MEQTNNNKILVTGATGFVGKALYQELSARGFSIRLLVRKLSQPDLKSGNEKDDMVIGDLLKPESLHTACIDQQVVIHLASIAHVSNNNLTETRRIIVDGTKNLLQAAVKNHVKRFVYVSSTLAQAASTGAGDITHYGQLKKAAEDLLLEAHNKGLIEVVILRPVNVYGVGMQGNIAVMISLIARNRLPPLPAVASRISLLGVSDLVQALTLAIVAKQAAGRIYTVTDGVEYSITDVEKAIYAALDKQFPRWRTPRVILFAAALLAGLGSHLRGQGSAIGLRTYRNLTRNNLFDSQAISSELGYTPGTSLYRELPRIIENILQKSKIRPEPK